MKKYELNVSEPKKPWQKKHKILLCIVLLAVAIPVFLYLYNHFAVQRMIAKQSEQLGEASAYSYQLPLDVLQAAEEFKKNFVEQKYADSEVNDHIDATEFKKLLIHDYEKAINSVYLQEISEPESLSRVLELIKYVPEMFDNQTMRDLLYKQNKDLVDFALHYKISTELNNPKNQVDQKKLNKQKQDIIAEQQAQILSLQGRVSGYQKREELLKKEIDELKNPPVLIEPEVLIE